MTGVCLTSRLATNATVPPDLLVEHLADPGDLRAGDPVDPERPDQVVDLAGGHALHVGLDHDRVQGLLGAPAGLEEAREVGACGDFRDLELDRADPGVPPTRPVPVAVGSPLRAPLVGR